MLLQLNEFLIASKRTKVVQVRILAFGLQQFDSVMQYNIQASQCHANHFSVFCWIHQVNNQIDYFEFKTKLGYLIGIGFY